MGKQLVSIIVAMIVPAMLWANQANHASATVELGAKIYYERCALCHGHDGMGEGILPLSIKNYPSANLLMSEDDVGVDALRHQISDARKNGQSMENMPPWRDELHDFEIDSVALFVDLLRNNVERGKALLATHIQSEIPTERIGRGVFVSRCALCHGQYGKGDGRMARIIKDPSPFNLTISGVPEQYLRKIILDGGAALGRSERMPPWRGDLTDTQIDSLIIYLNKIRNN